ncbi:MAG: right-handed parallel beta-helix repeat-containing protein [Nitriliruptorales bacterium]|nr:right-handed parallel beta-helix repeat-containing protein [Nitriliruptorales bacterium]
MSRMLRLLALASLVLTTVVVSASGVTAHEERESQFPDQGLDIPVYRPFDEEIPHLVVCKDESEAAIEAMPDGELKTLNEHLWDECKFEHIQDAVDAVEQQGTNIYVLPGLYREDPSRPEPACGSDYEEPVPYEAQVDCPTLLNLVTVAGDDPDDDDIVCDNQLCNLQIEGTGQTPEDVMIRGGFDGDGQWVKHNGIRADRADGFYLKNVGVELIRENGIYVHETDGYVLDGVLGRYNDLYAILTFTSDHGIIKNCETHHNGDSGIYPGSPADVNADSDETGPLTGDMRPAVEIFNCDTHHNALGFSGTAGNSVYFHDNKVHHNQAGYVTDSFVPNHPGMPQDHAWLEDNLIWANNENYYVNVQEGGACAEAETPAEVGYEDGVVCPAFPVPVGTGIMIAGGNHDFVNRNQIWDNWRQGAMLFHIPAALRDDFGLDQYDTSHFNHFTNNHLGESPDGLIQPNGIDFWWDDQGEGNCWQGNTNAAADDGTVTTNGPHGYPTDSGLPDCDSGGSVVLAGTTPRTASLAPCAEYDREDNPDPEGCDWMDSPSEPEGRQTASSDGDDSQGAPADDDDDDAAGGGGLPATGGPVAIVGLVGALLMGTAIGVRRMRAVAVPQT